MYAVEEIVDELCPWCIADGAAAAMFDADFTDVGLGVPDDVPGDVLVQVAKHTPGFAGWQQEHWLYHCGDASAFLGRAGYAELRDHEDALETIRRESSDFGWSEDQVESYLRNLHTDGDATAYLFRCLHCRGHLAYADGNVTKAHRLRAPRHDPPGPLVRADDQRTFAEQFAESNFAPISYRGLTVRPFHSASVAGLDEVVLHRVNSHLRLTQAVVVDSDATVEANKVRSRGLILWEDVAPNPTRVTLLNCNTLDIWNAWRFPDGVRSEWLNFQGVVAARVDALVDVVFMSAGIGPPDFTNLVVAVEKRKAGSKPSAVVSDVRNSWPDLLETCRSA